MLTNILSPKQSGQFPGKDNPVWYVRSHAPLSEFHGMFADVLAVM
jgi:hypothetical protein